MRMDSMSAKMLVGDASKNAPPRTSLEVCLYACVEAVLTSSERYNGSSELMALVLNRICDRMEHQTEILQAFQEDYRDHLKMFQEMSQAYLRNHGHTDGL